MDAESRVATEEHRSVLRDIYCVCVGELIDAGAAPEAVAEGRTRLRHVIRHRTVASMPRLTEDERDRWAEKLLEWLEDDHRTNGASMLPGPQVTIVTMVSVSGLPQDRAG